MMANRAILADYFVSKIGRKRLMQICGVMISTGLFTAVFFLSIPCTLAFMLVGLGVSSMVPSVYSAAGRHSKVPTGIALATVSSVSFWAFDGSTLDWIHLKAAGLRYSFAVNRGFSAPGITLFGFRVKAFAELAWQ